MHINMDSIMKKVNDWSKTDEGKRRMQKCIDDSLDRGSLTTPSGAEIIPRKWIVEMSQKFVDILCSIARSYDVPQSVLNHMEFVRADVSVVDRKAVVDVYFSGNQHRDSLMPETYDGVDNVIAVLKNGYAENEKIAKVCGDWHGIRVHGLTERTGMHFIQQAVDSFNRIYGAEYNVTSVAGDDYKQTETP